MPELPDVETFRRYLDETALHQRIGKVEVRDAAVLGNVSARSLQRLPEGHEFKGTRRHGKYLFVEMTGRSEWLLLHFGMTGSLAYYKDPESAPGHARVVFDFSNGCHLAYDSARKLGKVGLVDDVDDYLAEHGLGPDALGIGEAEFRERIGGHRGSLKGALMNQKILAGIGNEYADEILFQAHLDPRAEVSRLDRKAIHRLHLAMRKVLDKAVACRAEKDRLPDTWLLPHRGKDGACPRCGAGWKVTKVSGRTTFHCANCQQEASPAIHQSTELQTTP